MTFPAAGVIMFTAASAAMIVPAKRAPDPMIALRSE
jgi:hypothetical protein